MGIILAVISSASGETDRLFSIHKVPVEMVIEEFASVVTIESEQGGRPCRFNIFYLFQDPSFTFSPDGPLWRTFPSWIGRNGPRYQLRGNRGGIHPTGSSGSGFVFSGGSRVWWWHGLFCDIGFWCEPTFCRWWKGRWSAMPWRRLREAVRIAGHIRATTEAGRKQAV